MKNILFNLKKFLANKNTVTVLGVVIAILVLYAGYSYRVQQAIQPKPMPYALKTIQPRTKITEDMIGYTDVPPAMIKGSVITSSNLIVGKYSNYNTLIPEGSLFYTDTIISAADLPDSSLVNIEDGYVPYSLPVDVKSSYGNSIFPGNYIDIYFKALDANGKIMIGKLVENVKVLDVKDSSGKHVFENTDEDRISSSIIFAVPEEMHLLLRKAYYLQNSATIQAEVIPVPNTKSYSGVVGAITYSNQFLKDFIEVQTATVPEDQLPDVTDNTTTTSTDTTITVQ